MTRGGQISSRLLQWQGMPRTCQSCSKSCASMTNVPKGLRKRFVYISHIILSFVLVENKYSSVFTLLANYFQVELKDIKFFYMEDDCGSIATSAVDREMKQNIRKVVEYMETTHGIKVQQVYKSYFII